jgi:PTS system cellobiose-specific IIC component
MFTKLTNFLNDKLSGPMMKLANQRHLRAIRDGIVATLPLIIVGSFFLIVANPPLPASWSISQFLTSHAASIVLPYRMTMFIMTLYAIFGIGSSLAQSYKLDGLSGGVLAEIAYMLTILPVNVAAEGAEIKGWVIPMAKLGSSGLFVGIITTIIAIEIYHFIDAKGWKIKMPDAVPPAVSRSFESLVPTAIVILLIGSITYWFGFDWHGLVGTLVKPLVSASDGLGSVILLVFLTCFFWVFGIHGASIVGSLARPVWLILLEQNTTALASGQAMPNIAPEPFYQWFIWIGGAGCTIGLAILMAFFSKSAYAKDLGKTAFLPAVFNINEPLIFGAPIVLNPTLMIPFIISPIVNAVIAYGATAMGMVSRVSVNAPWTLPGPIGAYLACGGDWRAIILSLILIVLSVAIYYPFFRMWDSQLLIQEQNKDSAKEA